jgi:putative transposase
MLIFGERQLQRIVQAFVDYFNRSRPHQGIGQGIPCGPTVQGTGEIVSIPVLNGLHHEYRRAA